MDKRLPRAITKGQPGQSTSLKKLFPDPVFAKLFRFFQSALLPGINHKVSLQLKGKFLSR